MSEKFELSLWRDYQPSKDDIDIHNKKNPGKGIKILTDINDLVIGKCYYLWDDAETKKSEDYYWRYPCSYTHRTLLKGKNGENADDYRYHFIDEKGQHLATDGFSDKEIGVPLHRSREEKLYVLANNHMDLYRGKIYNIHFISKVDGTHTVTFECPQFYRDIYTLEKKKNEYLDWLQNKSKLKLFYDDEWYDFVLNKREEKKSKGYIVYSFEANDLFVEELSKTGYTLNLTDSEDTIEYSGLGTIGELTDRILLGTDWKFSEDCTTADLREYNTGTKYNAYLAKYEDIKTPAMIYKSSYSPCLKKYVYETEFYYDLKDIDYKNNFAEMQKHTIAAVRITKEKTDFPIYYTTETQTDCSGSTNNLIVTNSNFENFKDWKASGDADKTLLRPQRKEVGVFWLNVNKGGSIYTTNFTERMLESKPYGFKIKGEESKGIKFDLILKSGHNKIFTAENLLINNDYVIYPSKNISSPELELVFKDAVSIEEIMLYELAIRDSNNATLPVTKDNLNVNTYIQPTESKAIKFSYTINDNYSNRGYIDEDKYILLPNAIVAATSRAEKLYFIEPYKTLQEVQYATGDNTIEELDKTYIFPVDENFLFKKIGIKESEIKSSNKFEFKEDDEGNIEYPTFNEEKLQSLRPAIEYQNQYAKYTNEYKQDFYYTVLKVNAKGHDFYLWKNVYLKYTDQKRRLVTGSRSNRFNFIQDFAEKFEVYPKFEILHNSETGEVVYKDGYPIKRVYYTDRFGDVNYSGFKEGINVSGINRKIISNDLVTKMYVDNVEADYNDYGYISIQLASKNPSLENYIYNFRHYLNCGMLDDDFEERLQNHLVQLKAINEVYLREVELRDKLADTVNELKGYMDILETSFEESKATVENEKLKFSANVDYYGGSQKFTATSINKDYGKPLLNTPGEKDEPIEVDPKKDEYSYNNFYCIDPAYHFNNEDKTYTFFIEQQTLNEDSARGARTTWSNFNMSNIVKGTKGTYQQAKDTFEKKFKSSLVKIGDDLKSTYLLDTQEEFFYKNDSIPFDNKESYYIQKTSGKDKYYVPVTNPKESNLSNYYLRYVTSANSDWYYWDKGEVFVYCEIYGNNNEYRRIGYIINPRYIENKKEDFITWLQTKKGWNPARTFNCVIPSKQSNHKSCRSAIDQLINGENGQTSIIKDLHSARVEYYDTLKKYKEKVIKVNRLLAEKKSLIETFETPYIQFIKEGYWGGSGKQYVDSEVYYLDAASIGNDSALPKVEYTIDVIDLASIDYYKDHKIRIGDETFIKDVDMFGQTNGRANLERMMITTLDRQLDDSSKHKITVRNYTSRFQELFQRITASVTSVETKEADWSKAEILNSNGTIPSSLLTAIHGENSSWVNNQIGLLNGYEQNETGITLTSLIDGNYKLKMTSFGIFLTETALQNDTWTTAISAKGINADVIKTGHLMTNKVSILSEDQPAQVWDNLGISMYSGEGTIDYMTINEKTFVRLDQFGLYFVENSSGYGVSSNGIPWFKGLSYTEALDRIRTGVKGNSGEYIVKPATVSITKLGFRYNAEKNDANITIGKLDDNNDGILFKKNNKIIFRVATDGKAQIAGFEFSEDWMRSIKETKFYRDSKTKKEKYKFIELNTNGEAVFGNIKLIGGDIGSAVSGQYVTINQAILGPFAVWKDGAGTTSYDEYLYAEYNNGKAIDYINLPSGRTYWAWSSKNEAGAKALLNRPDKVYLGDFPLSKGIIAASKFGFGEDLSKNFGNTKDGVVLSIGNNFWVHSAGYGYCGGNFQFNGNLYAESITANEINYNGQDIMDVIKQNSSQVTTYITEYLSSGAGAALGVSNKDNEVALELTSVVDLPCYTVSSQSLKITGAALHFQYKSYDYYLVVCQYGLRLAVKESREGMYMLQKIKTEMIS